MTLEVRLRDALKCINSIKDCSNLERALYITVVTAMLELMEIQEASISKGIPPGQKIDNASYSCAWGLDDLEISIKKSWDPDDKDIIESLKLGN